jgi:hypothetical protein
MRWSVLLEAMMRKRPIKMENPDPHFVNHLMKHGWTVEKLTGTEEYRAWPPEET